MSSLVREVEGVRVLPLGEVWSNLEGTPAVDRLAQALLLTGCKFQDERLRYVTSPSVAFVGIGGLALAECADTDEEIKDRICEIRKQTKNMMGASAAFSYLNTTDKLPSEMYEHATNLGHYSIAHTVYVNFVIAGISEAAELELSLQRDLVHLSKLTNTRTIVQNAPPLVIQPGEDTQTLDKLYDQILETTSRLRTSKDSDTLEAINSLFPTSKATLLMLSSDLSNLRKLCALRYDAGKEKELRAVLASLSEQLKILWPEIFKFTEVE